MTAAHWTLLAWAVLLASRAPALIREICQDDSIPRMEKRVPRGIKLFTLILMIALNAWIICVVVFKL